MASKFESEEVIGDNLSLSLTNLLTKVVSNLPTSNVETAKDSGFLVDGSREVLTQQLDFSWCIESIVDPNLRDALQREILKIGNTIEIIFDKKAKWGSPADFYKFLKDKIEANKLGNHTPSQPVLIIAPDGSVFTDVDEHGVAIHSVIDLDDGVLACVIDHHGEKASRLHSDTTAQQADPAIASLNSLGYDPLIYIIEMYLNDIDQDIVLTIIKIILDIFKRILTSEAYQKYKDKFDFATARLDELIYADSEKDRHIGIVDPKEIYGENWLLHVKLCEYLFGPISEVRFQPDSSKKLLSALPKSLSRIINYTFDPRKNADSVANNSYSPEVSDWANTIKNTAFTPRLEVLSHFASQGTPLSISTLIETHPSSRLLIPDAMIQHLNNQDYVLDPTRQVYIFPRVNESRRTSYTIYGPTMALNMLAEFLNVAEVWFEQIFGTPKTSINTNRSLLYECLKFVYERPSECIFSPNYQQDVIGHIAGHRRPSRFLSIDFINKISEWFVNYSYLFTKSTNPELYNLNSTLNTELINKIAYKGLYVLLKKFVNETQYQPDVLTNTRYGMYLDTTNISSIIASNSSVMEYAPITNKRRLEIISQREQQIQFKQLR